MPQDPEVLSKHTITGMSQSDCCWLLLQVLMSLEIVSQRTSTTMCMFTLGLRQLIVIWGEKKTTIPLQPEDIKKIIIYTGKTGLTPDTILCNFWLELWQYIGVKCGYTRFFPDLQQLRNRTLSKLRGFLPAGVPNNLTFQRLSQWLW